MHKNNFLHDFLYVVVMMFLLHQSQDNLGNMSVNKKIYIFCIIFIKCV